jgi:hypothetical protein
MLWNKINFKPPHAFIAKLFWFSWSMDQVALIMVFFMWWLFQDHGPYMYLYLYISLVSKQSKSKIQNYLKTPQICWVWSDRECPADIVRSSRTMSGPSGPGVFKPLTSSSSSCCGKPLGMVPQQGQWRRQWIRWWCWQWRTRGVWVKTLLFLLAFWCLLPKGRRSSI